MRRDADRPLFKDVVEGTVGAQGRARADRVGGAGARTGHGRASTGWCARSCWPAPTSWCIARTCRPGWRSTSMSRSPTPSTTRASRTSSIRCSTAWRARRGPPSSCGSRSMARQAHRRVRADRPLLRAARPRLQGRRRAEERQRLSAGRSRDTTSWSRPTRSSSGVHFLADEKPELVAAQALARLPLRSRRRRRDALHLSALAVACDAAGTERWVAGFARGLAADQRRYGIVLCGGDTVVYAGTAHRHHHRLRPRARAARGLTRDGARAGDELWVSGTIGDGALGLLAARGRLGQSRRSRSAIGCRSRARRLGPRLVGIASRDGRCLRRPAGRCRPHRRRVAAWRSRSNASACRCPPPPGARVAAEPTLWAERAGRRRRLRTR